MSRKLILRILVGCAILFALIFGSKIVETNQKGYYQIKQAAVTGTMSARMTPGMYLQNFGDIQTWPKAETFYFTKDSEEGASRDESIEVRFNDGSLCDISGTLRILMPTSEQQAIDLVTKHGYKSYSDLEARLIQPTIRNILRLTANLMSARQSYSEKRTDFIAWAWEQMENGSFKTEEIVKKVKDPVSGELVTKTFKVIKRDNTGNPLHNNNPLEGTGIKLANFEVKVFAYSDTVQEQIKAQQKALMAVETSKAKSQEAEQEKIKIEAEGKAAVSKAQYEEEQKKVRAVVEAKRKLEVAVLARKEAAETKQKEILLGQGEAARKKLVMQADGALKQKLAAWVEAQKAWAEAFSKRNVPSTYFAGGSGKTSDSQFSTFMQLMNVKNAKELSLSMGVDKGAIASRGE